MTWTLSMVLRLLAKAPMNEIAQVAAVPLGKVEEPKRVIQLQVFQQEAAHRMQIALAVEHTKALH